MVCCLSVCPSVCLSVTLSCRGHIDLNTWKISWLISLAFPLSADINSTDILHLNCKRDNPNFSRNRSGVWKNWLRAYKTGNISETVEDRAKVAINDLHKIVHGLSIAAKMYDLEWPLSEIQGHWFFKCHKNDEIQLRNDSEWLEALSIRPTYSCAHALTYLLTYVSSQNNHCPLRLACDIVSWLFSEWFVFRSTAVVDHE